ncbi:E3 ubiquitin-protein ligase PUB23 [Salvia hispanica]|uniref:E3 ubiquitin-protein ligase PUB23 n=1 Tax=Salvia hispanica TaxID=49212 RepID=UPI002008F804|nr:E3 ubiquitin-protein ligase PUB23 [Salvia hispanica]
MADTEIEIEIPSYFLCPITLAIMRDPVTVSTGITYDRHSIEKWLFTQQKTTCPATKQHLPSLDLTPNITLRRLIQSWCTLHALQRLPTPKPPLTRPHLLRLLSSAAHSHSLQSLKSAAAESHTNRRIMAAAGAPEFLASLITTPAAEDALSLLCALQLPESSLKPLSTPNFIQSLTLILQIGSYESRSYAINLLRSITEIADPSTLTSLNPQFFTEIAQFLKSDDITRKERKSALKTLASVCIWGRNRVKAVEAGVVSAAIDLLLETSEKRMCEMLMGVVEVLCQCAEGRAELVGHAAGLAVVSKKILRVSGAASEKGVRILQAVSRHSATKAVVAEMMQSGVVGKLCLVVQVDCGVKIKERAMEILKAHARAWRNSPCLPYHFISSYPS